MLTISATKLAKLALDDVCERCWWLEQQIKLPYQSFPGVFSTLDKASKLCLEHWVMTRGLTPPWMSQFSTFKTLIKPPHFTKFGFTHGGLHVRGVADAIVLLEDDTLLIPDFKTAIFTEAQERMVPVYAAQLNCYAMAAENQAIGDVSQIAIVYCQPQAAGEEMDIDRVSGFGVHFQALAMPVHRNDERIKQMCDRAAGILSQDKPPTPYLQCEECPRVEHMYNILTGGSN